MITTQADVGPPPNIIKKASLSEEFLWIIKQTVWQETGFLWMQHVL